MNKLDHDATLDDLRSEGDLNLSPRRRQWQAKQNDPVTREWLEKDAQYFLHQSLSTPCLDVLQGCDGAYLENLRGKQILDFHGNSVHQVGFGHPKIISAIKDQLDSLPFCTRRYTNLPAIQLAERLTEVAPGNLNKVLFSPGGTSAIGMALKLARMATGRHKTISMWDSFHGASLDAISIGGEAIFRKDMGPLLSGTEHVPPANPQHCPFGCAGECSLQCADYIEYVLAKEGDVAAVICETVRSTPYFPPKEYWHKVRQACDRHGALLILDEIPHCLGRTGKMFTCEHYDVVPDMLVIGKGLGGGVFPLAALLARDDLNIAQDRALGHYTHEKNPVACAAALATLNVIEEEGLLDKATSFGKHALNRLHEIQTQYDIIRDVRGLGLLLGVELTTIENGSANDLAESVLYRCLDKGLSFKLSMGNILTLSPPLTILLSDLDKALNIIEEAISEVSTI